MGKVIDSLEKPMRLAQIIVTLLIAGLIAPVASYFSFQNSVATEINKVKLDLSEHYIKKVSIVDDIKEINKSLSDIKVKIGNIEGKLDR